MKKWILVSGVIGAFLCLCMIGAVFNSQYEIKPSSPKTEIAQPSPVIEKLNPTPTIQDALQAERDRLDKEQANKPKLELDPDWTCNALGDYQVMKGIVTNRDSKPHKFVKISAQVSYGSLKSDNWAYLDSSVLNPGESSSFTVMVKDPLPGSNQATCHIFLERNPA